MPGQVLREATYGLVDAFYKFGGQAQSRRAYGSHRRLMQRIADSVAHLVSGLKRARGKSQQRVGLVLAAALAPLDCAPDGTLHDRRNVYFPAERIPDQLTAGVIGSLPHITACSRHAGYNPGRGDLGGKTQASAGLLHGINCAKRCMSDGGSHGQTCRGGSFDCAFDSTAPRRLQVRPDATRTLNRPGDGVAHERLFPELLCHFDARLRCGFDRKLHLDADGQNPSNRALHGIALSGPEADAGFGRASNRSANHLTYDRRAHPGNLTRCLDDADNRVLDESAGFDTDLVNCLDHTRYGIAGEMADPPSHNMSAG